MVHTFDQIQKDSSSQPQRHIEEDQSYPEPDNFSDEDDLGPNMMTEGDLHNENRSAAFAEEHQISLDLTPCSHNTNMIQPDEANESSAQFGQQEDILSAEKKSSARSMLTSNDKHSVADVSPSRRSSQSSQGHNADDQSCKFGTVGSSINRIQEFDAARLAPTDNHQEEGTFCNVSFGEVDPQLSKLFKSASTAKTSKKLKAEELEDLQDFL